jgi:acetyl esterase/lipase
MAPVLDNQERFWQGLLMAQKFSLRHPDMKISLPLVLFAAGLGASALLAQPSTNNPQSAIRNPQSQAVPGGTPATAGPDGIGTLRNPQSPPSRQRLPAGVTAVRDLEYGRAGAKVLHLDLYLPANSGKPLPLLVWIHGGAWRSGAKDGDVIPMLPLATNGYAMASVEYRLSQEAIFPAQIYDCKAAIRWLRANAAKYNLDPGRFAAMGASAGGHLAALVGASGGVAALEGDVNDLKESSRVQAVVDWYGPADLLQIGIPSSDIKHNEPGSPESQLIGGALLEHKDKAAQASPVTYVSKESPPFLIMHGDSDRSVPFNQSELLLAALKKAGVDATLIPEKGIGHGFSGPQYLPPVREFLQRCLK